MNISISERFTKHGTLSERIQAIASAGFSHINISGVNCKKIMSRGDDYTDNYNALIKDNNLQVDWMHAPFGTTSIYWDDPDKWMLSMAILRYSIQTCAKLNGSTLVIHPLDGGYDPQHENHEAQLTQLKKAFSLLVEDGKKHNVRIATENMTKRIRSDELLTYLFKNVEDLYFCFDIGHANLYDAIPFHVDNFGDKIVALHLHDNNGEQDDHLIPGDGSIDYTYLVDRLHNDNYDGVWGLECTQKPDNYQGGLELAEKAYKNTLKIIGH